MSRPIWEGEPDLSSPFLGERKIIQTLHHLSLLEGEYFIIGGANLVLRGIKIATPDIDMLVNDEVFERLKRLKGSVLKNPPGSAKMRGAMNETVWVSNRHTPIPISATTEMGDGYYPMSFESHRSQVELVNSFPCLKLDAVIAAKEALQRPNDIQDLDLIARSLGRTTILPEPAFTPPYYES